MIMSAPVLFVLAHPDLRASRANRAFAAAAATVDGVTVHDLYDTYPDLFVDGFAERKLIDRAGALVLQAPIYWYAGPGLLKEWIDRTFVSGWAYGRGGRALVGKKMLVSITTGSAHEAYGPGGRHAHPIEDYLKPYRQIAAFCGMAWQEPLVFFHARATTSADLDVHAHLLTERLEALAAPA
jgi:putative NADPH-quinone reductase